MSVRKDDSGRRWVQAEVIVPGTPEEVWAAIATAEGVSSWFVPTEKRDDGTMVSHFGPGMDSVATETAWDPPHRFAAESEFAPGAPKIATEWIVEARDGNTCLVRVVHSLFTDRDDWDDQLGAIEGGWADYFSILHLYLSHFRGEAYAGFQLMGMTTQPTAETWDRVASELGLEAAAPGQNRRSSNPGLQFAGIVEKCGAGGHPQQVLIRLSEPNPGVAHLFALSMGAVVVVSIRFFLYGKTAAKVVSMHEPQWQAWIQKLFPPNPEGQPAPMCGATTIEARATYRFKLSAERVFDAWLDPARVRMWMGAALKSLGLSGDIRRVEIDSRVGGGFCFSDMRDGTEAVHRGEYLEIDRPRSLEFTWTVGDEVETTPSRVSLSIEPEGTGCVATIVHQMDPKWAEYVARTSDGWTRMLKAVETTS